MLESLETLGDEKRRIAEREAEVAKLQESKEAAVAEEDFDLAEELKAKIEATRLQPLKASLVELSLRRCDLSGSSVLNLCEQMVGSSVRSLDLSANSIGDAGAVHIALCLSTRSPSSSALASGSSPCRPGLTTLWLENCEIQENGAKTLAHSITNNRHSVRKRRHPEGIPNTVA